MENIGITGASGVLGKILLKKLKKDKLNCDCFMGDIKSKEEIRYWLKKNQFDAVIHFAAIVPTEEVKKNPDEAYRVNVIGTNNLVDEISSSGQIPWLFYASTSHIYKSKNSPINEDDGKEPISEYGKTKYEAEEIAIKKYENLCVGRIFSFYHDTQQKPFLYPTIKERLATENLNKPFNLYGAQSVRDFLNAEEVVDIIIKLMEKRVTGIYNIASGKGVKIKDFIQKLTSKKLNIKEIGENDYLVADINKLNKVLSE